MAILNSVLLSLMSCKPINKDTTRSLLQNQKPCEQWSSHGDGRATTTPCLEIVVLDEHSSNRCEDSCRDGKNEGVVDSREVRRDDWPSLLCG
jgi:hypothetical protein